MVIGWMEYFAPFWALCWSHKGLIWRHLVDALVVLVFALIMFGHYFARVRKRKVVTLILFGCKVSVLVYFSLSSLLKYNNT